jgi:hypothetical protein
MDRYAFDDLHKLTNKIGEAEIGKTNLDDYKVALLVCQVIKYELYNYSDRMESYKAWNEIEKLLLEKKFI